MKFDISMSETRYETGSVDSKRPDPKAGFLPAFFIVGQTIETLPEFFACFKLSQSIPRAAVDVLVA